MPASPPSRTTRLDALPTVVLDGLRLHAVDEATCVAWTMACLEGGTGGWIATANLDHLRRLRHDTGFRASYAQATVVVADGMPLVWASRLQGTPLPGRVAGSDLIFSLSAGAGRAGRAIFLLGGNPGTAESAAAELQRRNPGLRLAGTACPAPGFERDPAQLAALRAQLQASGADVVFVALGSPKQELLIGNLRDVLPRAFWIGVGISFSFVCGEVRRAPAWVQRLGLEWLHRMVQEPRRLARRYLVDGLPFAAGLLLRALGARLRGRRGS